jgi:hypothetical protein
MTPLARRLARVLPDWAVAPTLAVIYAGLLVAVWLCFGVQPADIMYIDVTAAR